MEQNTLSLIFFSYSYNRVMKLATTDKSTQPPDRILIWAPLAALIVCVSLALGILTIYFFSVVPIVVAAWWCCAWRQGLSKQSSVTKTIEIGPKNS
jgi:fatty acid desaturase